MNTDIALLSAEEKITSPVENEAPNVNAKSSEVITFPGGLSIEELEAGQPDGKVATSGKKACFEFVLIDINPVFYFVSVAVAFQWIMVVNLT